MDGAYANRRPPRGAASGWLVLVTLTLAAAGVALIWFSQHTSRWAPPPVPRSAAAPATRPLALSGQRAGFASHTISRSAAVPPPSVVRSTGWLGRSVPVTVRIPAIGVNAHIIALGLGYRGAAAVPPLSTPMVASWYDLEAAPGQLGAAVLSGHVDSAATGPAVFYRLGDLHHGDLIFVTRRDRRTAVFQVSEVALYPQWSFPRWRVYGAATRPVLRLITCGGQFDDKAHVYLDRTVAFASYLGQL